MFFVLIVDTLFHKLSVVKQKTTDRKENPIHLTLRSCLMAGFFPITSKITAQTIVQ